MRENRTIIIACLVIIGISLYLFATKNDSCPESLNIRFSKLLVQDKQTKNGVAVISVENNKLLVKSANNQINDYFADNTDRIEQSEYSFPVGGKCRGALWDGMEITKIDKASFLVGVEQELKKNFEEFEFSLIK